MTAGQYPRTVYTADPNPRRRPITMAELQEPFLTVADVARKFKTSKMTIYRLISPEDPNQPVLGHYRIGRQIRIPVRALRAFLGEVYIEGEQE